MSSSQPCSMLRACTRTTLRTRNDEIRGGTMTYKVLFREIESLDGVLQHELVFQLVTSLRRLARRVLGA